MAIEKELLNRLLVDYKYTQPEQIALEPFRGRITISIPACCSVYHLALPYTNPWCG